jgi:hypothetical protein
MGLLATERFSDRKLKQRIDGNWTAQRGWDVSGYSDSNEAISAVGVQPGDPHPLNTDLKCTDIWVAEDKLTLAHVLATYEITCLLDNPENPVLRAPIIRWKWGKVSQPIDTDMNGNAILNSAYDAPKSPFHRNFSVRFLTITRYEPYYDQSAAENFTDTVNNGSITFEGNEFDAGQVYCLSIAPVEDYQEGSTYVKIAYAFEIRTPNAPNLTDLQIRHPFQLRFMDQGLRAQYSNSGTDTLGQLYLGSGEPVTHDVLLDGDGTPIDDTIKVTAGGLNAVSQDLPDDVLVDTIQDDEGNDTAVFLIYMIYAEMDFTQIGVSIGGGGSGG